MIIFCIFSLLTGGSRDRASVTAPITILNFEGHQDQWARALEAIGMHNNALIL